MIQDNEHGLNIYYYFTPDLYNNTPVGGYPRSEYYIPGYSKLRVEVREQQDTTQQSELRFKSLRVYTNDSSDDNYYTEELEAWYASYPRLYYWSIYINNLIVQEDNVIHIELVLDDDTKLEYTATLKKYDYKELSFDTLEVSQANILGTKFTMTGTATAVNVGKLPIYPIIIDPNPKAITNCKIYQDEISADTLITEVSTTITSLGDNKYQITTGAFPIESQLINPKRLIFELLDQPGEWLKANLTNFKINSGQVDVNSLSSNHIIRDIYYDDTNDELKFGYGTAASTIGDDPVEHNFNGTIGCDNIQAYDGTSGFENIDVLNDLKVEHKLTVENDTNVANSLDVHHINSNNVEEGGFIHGTTYSASVGFTVGTKDSNGDVIKQCTMTEDGINGNAATASKVDVTTDNHTSGSNDTVFLVFSKSGGSPQELYNSNYAQIQRQIGTTSQDGYQLLQLGNNIASGNANNQRGLLRLFQSSQYWTNLWANSGSANYQTYLPAHNGTLVNVTRLDSITSATSGNFTLKESYLNFDVIEVFYVYDDSSGGWQSSRMLVGGSGSRAIELVGTTDNGTNLYHAVAKYTFNGTSVTKDYERRWMIRTSGYPTRTNNTTSIKIWRVLGYKFS